MRVKLNVDRATQLAAQQAGDVIEVGDDEGRRLIASGQAEPAGRAESPEAKAESVRRPSRRREASD
ncbi:MAG: hypothetical protein RBS99_12145 [Rhodospirillales bacterium]|nr:hypothetical protein [Rhodospirillales bacterium]